MKKKVLATLSALSLSISLTPAAFASEQSVLPVTEHTVVSDSKIASDTFYERLRVGSTSREIYGYSFVPEYGWPDVIDIRLYEDKNGLTFARVKGVAPGEALVTVDIGNGEKRYYYFTVKKN
ncbi:hypothetical protein [Aneurinibacillus thermoaerophilus]|uniref:hypothetical protein n=1 Tax=Aneurinibacillus thermoaerophilus TaxID=143495 RepID=UPI002E1FE837|nr:hypothetical protein [Aneurinibacillus thermoaerophilus]MED0735975.1 hypothetical protein [Aneurinibacillus thermoaerophilus]MED0763029.1 hypothetical protein [Aneurinibacillus thermoaerophilus]